MTISNNTNKLLEFHALLVERGLEKTLSTLVSEAAQVGKSNQEVQLFFESIVASNPGGDTQTKQLSHEIASLSVGSTKSRSTESDSVTSYQSAKDVFNDIGSRSSASGNATGSDQSAISPESESKDGNEHKQPAKKRRLSLETPAKSRAKVQSSKGGPLSAPAKNKNAPKTPFCRIRPEEVVYVDDRLKDNRYTVKGGTSGDFGYKAHVDLIVKHGKGFTKEKNKKKRGSYGGGRITMESHSIKFA
ncbi:jun-like transcription factor [Coemansia sp. RSA 1813]|nr:jun-like transcription factor [Coemansia sp. RSA 1646]KAJ1767679.1 jun-like transcription factor [Coemansia sp. RSA 1843]KAJ2086236.1 jun-like transcription factor [Coemansia sp. RSA 986]KAJ2214898.1 jun-like transcription factor [Coemansia sp. RSA 487]KAJ2563948.1 jun-like transcription factor [Coemansia sp. RSA 1813]